MTFPLAAHVGTPEAMTCPHGHAPPWDKAPALHMRGTWLHCCRDCAPVTYMLFVFTLDTGRLHDETLALLDRVERRYQRRIQVFYPDAKLVEQYVRDNGINGFYLGVEERLSCCNIRKIEPFKRAVAGHRAWVTGVRREQSQERALGEPVSWDERYGLWKISPLLDWTDQDVWAYIKARNLPYNALHDRGYPSIGCAPCTRAVEPGADPRSGRWWWENPDSRECGLQPRRRVIPLKIEPRRTAAAAAGC